MMTCLKVLEAHEHHWPLETNFVSQSLSPATHAQTIHLTNRRSSVSVCCTPEPKFSTRIQTILKPIRNESPKKSVFDVQEFKGLEI